MSERASVGSVMMIIYCSQSHGRTLHQVFVIQHAHTHTRHCCSVVNKLYLCPWKIAPLLSNLFPDWHRCRHHRRRRERPLVIQHAMPRVAVSNSVWLSLFITTAVERSSRSSSSSSQLISIYFPSRLLCLHCAYYYRVRSRWRRCPQGIRVVININCCCSYSNSISSPFLRLLSLEQYFK